MTSSIHSRSRPVSCALIASLTFLCACSSDSDSDLSSSLDLARALWRGATTSESVAREQAAAIPYASIGYRVGDGAQQLLVEEGAFGPDIMWTAASHVVIGTRGGRVIRTVGLEKNVSHTTFISSTEPILGAVIRGEVRNETLRVDFADDGSDFATLSCTLRLIGREKIEILGTAISTRRVEEICSSNSISWSFKNIYWVDSDSELVWRSVQNIHPDLPAIEVTTLRPPAAPTAETPH